MIRTLAGILAVVIAAPVLAEQSETMYACSIGGGRHNDVLLVSSGSRSYVKLSGQRVPATLTETGGVKRWAWGSNAIALDDKRIARYYEAGDDKNPKGTFRCHELK